MCWHIFFVRTICSCHISSYPIGDKALNTHLRQKIKPPKRWQLSVQGITCNAVVLSEMFEKDVCVAQTLS
jgi:hypothetical protein